MGGWSVKKSYWICSGVLLAIVIGMIVFGVVQDYQMKKDKLKKSVKRTMLSAGCVEMEEVEKEEDSDVPPLPNDEQLLHGGEEVDLSSLADAEGMLSQISGSDVDGPELFKRVGSTLLSNAQFKITDTKISGRDAEVTVHIYYENHEGEVVLEYFYYQDEWMLSNTVDALKDLAVDGRSFDELESEAFETVVDYMKSM